MLKLTNRTESLQPQIYGNLIYDVDKRSITYRSLEKASAVISESLDIHTEKKKNEIGSFPRTTNDISPMWIKALNMKGKTFKPKIKSTHHERKYS